jgi:hypothetical protein
MPLEAMTGRVESLHVGPDHRFSKATVATAALVAGLGVAGDAHSGATVRHRSRVRVDPTQPNLRQVHLIGVELYDELVGRGFTVRPGVLGENITTRGIDLLALPTGSVLRIGDRALVAITGLRNPCRQLDGVEPGLQQAVLDRTPEGDLVRRAGVMGVVVLGGDVAEGDEIDVSAPPGPHRPLDPV